MREPPKKPAPRPPGVPLSDEEEAEKTKPGSQNAGLALSQALSTWPVRDMDHRTLARGSEPPPLEAIDAILNEDVFRPAQQVPQRGLLVGVVRFLRRLHELPGLRSSRGGDQSEQ